MSHERLELRATGHSEEFNEELNVYENCEDI